MSERFDAVVIGGGVGGLVAVSLLARAGLRALLLERAETLVGPGGDAALRALDPRVVAELKLARHGLKFVQRDLALTFLRSAGQPVALVRDRHAVARALAALSPADAAAYAPFQSERLALARALRPAWWDGAPLAEAAANLKQPQCDLLDRLCVTSAACWLAAHFESDALKAALAFDAAACGFAPSEPGSALGLIWSAAQEMCGLQGAVAIPRGGAGVLAQALAQAAQTSGAQIRTNSTVTSLSIANGRVAGVVLASGEQIDAPRVVSALGRRDTLENLLPTALIGLGAAQVHPAAQTAVATLVMGLNRAPDLGGGMTLADKRIVIAERLETYETAFYAARLGEMPREPVLELIVPPAETAAREMASRLLFYANVWPVPVPFDRDGLVRTVTAQIERHIPGFGGGIASCDVLPAHAVLPSVERLSAPAAARIGTPIPGLYLCGVDAEPADAISGRAARQAARAVLAAHRSGGVR